jgi:S-adenosylmethionine hydrolase
MDVRPSGIVTLLTDFGTDDTYVAQMKGVMLSVAPSLRFVDITHAVAPQDVAEGAWLLRGAYRAFPAGTVHLCVVDPGVGTGRRGIAGAADDWMFVAPDNGLLSWPVRAATTTPVIIELTRAEYFRADVSPTFHGRDVFAPVAAHLASGVPLDRLGERIGDAVVLPIPDVSEDGGCLRGRVVHVDRFGNLITDIEAGLVARRFGDDPRVVVRACGRDVRGLNRTYGDAAPGALLALVESSGCLEIAIRDGSAAVALGCGRGAEVVVERAMRSSG